MTQSSSGLRIAVMLFGDITYDSRVIREARSLAQAGHRVTIYCPGGTFAGAQRDAIELVTLPVRFRRALPGAPDTSSGGRLGRATGRMRRLRDYAVNVWSWGRIAAARAADADVWHVHDLPAMLAVGRRCPPGIRVVYDVHDVFVESGAAGRLPAPVRWVLRRIERRHARRADLVVTVNHGLADLFVQRFGIKPPLAIHNCPPRWQVPQPRPDRIRAATGIAAEAPIVLYHGALGSNRGLHELCDAFLEPGLEDAHLAFLGFGRDRDTLARHASDPAFGGRIHLLDPVPPDELMPWVASADVGAMVFPPASLNLYLSTPNKLFECLAAGVPVVVSPFPVVRRIVERDAAGRLGTVADEPTAAAIAVAVRQMLELDSSARTEQRERCLEAAFARWNWQAQVQPLLEAYAGFSRASRNLRAPTPHRA